MQHCALSSRAGARPVSAATSFAVMVLRVFWVLNLLLGIIFWLGWVNPVDVPLAVHIILGSGVVLSLWYLGLAASRRGMWALPPAALFIGVLLVLAGLGQLYFSWWQGLTASIVHLVLAFMAIGIGEAW